MSAVTPRTSPAGERESTGTRLGRFPQKRLSEDPCNNDTKSEHSQMEIKIAMKWMHFNELRVKKKLMYTSRTFGSSLVGSVTEERLDLLPF